MHLLSLLSYRYLHEAPWNKPQRPHPQDQAAGTLSLLAYSSAQGLYLTHHAENDEIPFGSEVPLRVGEAYLETSASNRFTLYFDPNRNAFTEKKVAPNECRSSSLSIWPLPVGEYQQVPRPSTQPHWKKGPARPTWAFKNVLIRVPSSTPASLTKSLIRSSSCRVQNTSPMCLWERRSSRTAKNIQGRYRERRSFKVMLMDAVHQKLPKGRASRKVSRSWTSFSDRMQEGRVPPTRSTLSSQALPRERMRRRAKDNSLLIALGMAITHPRSNWDKCKGNWRQRRRNTSRQW